MRKPDWTPPRSNELAVGAVVLGLGVLAVGSVFRGGPAPAPLEVDPSGSPGLSAMPQARADRPLRRVAAGVAATAARPGAGRGRLTGTSAQLRAAGRLRARTYVNPEVGLRLELPAGWEPVAFVDDGLVSFSHRNGGLLTLLLEGRRGETLEDHANAAIALFDSRYVDGEPTTTRPARIAGRAALQILRTYALKVPVFTGAKALRSDWICDYRGLVLRVTWRQFVKGRVDEAPWEQALAGLQLTSDPTRLELDGAAVPRADKDEVQARLLAAGRREGDRYTNPALGLSFRTPPRGRALEPDSTTLFDTGPSDDGRTRVSLYLYAMTPQPALLLERVWLRNPILQKCIRRSHAKRKPTATPRTIQGRPAVEASWEGWIGNEQLAFWTLIVVDGTRVVIFESSSRGPDLVDRERLTSSLRFGS